MSARQQMVPFPLRLPKQYLSELRSLADISGRTVANLMRLILKEGIIKHGGKVK
jgi:hypothetical protein